MRALVLAAGLGTRLRPLTLDRAKPSLPVIGIPSLWFGAWHLKSELRIDAFAINVSHRPETVRAAGDDPELRRFTGVKFLYSDESSGILGSSGALWQLKDWIGTSTLAVCNGDSICFPEWKRMTEFHRQKKAKLTLHVRSFADAHEPYTDIELGPGDRVARFGEKAGRGIMFSGNYLIEPELLERLPAGASELRPTLLEPLAREGGLFAYREDVPWFDTGTVAAYADTQFELLRAIPAVRQLVEVKMREERTGCWVPRDWKHGAGRPGLAGPVILTGSQEEWAQHAILYGPRFIGIEPPPPGMKIPHTNAVVLSAHVQRL